MMLENVARPSALVEAAQRRLKIAIERLKLDAMDSAIAPQTEGITLRSVDSLRAPLPFPRMIAGSGRQQRKNVGAQDVRKIISNTLRKTNLTSLPGWHPVKTKNFDPPPYNDDAVYQRKIRFAEPVPVNGFKLSCVNITGAIGLGTIFKEMTVTRLDVYGSDVEGVIVSADGPFGHTSPQEFSDFGVPGSRRGHVAIEICPKDQEWLHTDDANVLFTIFCTVPNGTPSAGTVIIDIHAMYRNTITALKLRRNPALADSFATTLQDDPPDRQSSEGHVPAEKLVVPDEQVL